MARADANGVPSWLLRVRDTARAKHPCNGIRLSKGRVLTARHCIDDEHGYVQLAEGEEPTKAPLGWMSRTLDVAMLLAKPSTHAVSISQIREQAELSRIPLWVATQRAKPFRVHIDSVDEHFIRVKAPLCFGDSGSPLLTKQGRRWVVLGVLDVGAEDCDPQGINRFVRVDNLPQRNRLD